MSKISMPSTVKVEFFGVHAQGIYCTIEIGHLEATYPALYPSFVEPVKAGTVYFIQRTRVLLPKRLLKSRRLYIPLTK